VSTFAKSVKAHEFVYGGYEVGSGGPIWCKICGWDVEHDVHKITKQGRELKKAFEEFVEEVVQKMDKEKK
jgi:hypothetical protein